MQGNVFDLAVGVIIGSAFGNIVSSFVKDILMPPIGLLLGNVDFSEIFVSLSGGKYATLAQAQEAGAVTLNIGIFLNAVIDFMIIGFVIFLLIRQLKKIEKQEKPVEATTKPCPYCLTDIALKAIRCPACTSELKK